MDAMRWMKIVIMVGVVVSMPMVGRGAGAVKVYPAPASEPMSKMYTVSVEGKSSPVYIAKVNSMVDEREQLAGEAGFTSFDLDGIAIVTVTYSGKVTAAKVLPASRGIVAQISGNTISFTVSKPDPLTLEVNGDWNNSLHVFVNPMEAEPDLKDPHLIYFGPGIHEIEPMTLSSGTTVYLAGGAVVYGKALADKSQMKFRGIFTLEGDNITLRGRGIIDGSRMPPHTLNLVATSGTNLHLEGVILRDNGTFNLPIRGSNHVTIKNVKIFGHLLNSDGIDIINSQDVDISDSFVRTFDDEIAMKTSLPHGQPTKNVLVHHCVLWNQRAHALHLGMNIHDDIENVTFKDSDIIHDKGHDWLLRVFDGENGGTSKNIVWEDIRVEECRRLISLYIGHHDKKNIDAPLGHIEDITFRNITSPKPEWDQGMWLLGGDKDHAVHGVRFDNVSIAGKPLKVGDIQNDGFADGVVVKP